MTRKPLPGLRQDPKVGDRVKIQGRPDYWGTVTWSKDLPFAKLTVQPDAGQGMTLRKRTVWKDRLLEVRAKP